MVLLLVLITIMVFLVVDYWLRKEDQTIGEQENVFASPIFLSPEKALQPVGELESRRYHPGHAWVMQGEGQEALIGFDNFISTLFPEEICIDKLPPRGTRVQQGTPICRIGLGKRQAPLLAPVSGEVVETNPACTVPIVLPTQKALHSWIIKIRPRHFHREVNNLLSPEQAAILNNRLRDDLYTHVIFGQYLNDGGTLSPNFVRELSEAQWQELLLRYFSYAGVDK